MTSLPIPMLIKAVTMDTLSLKIKGILLNKSLEIFLPKLLGGSTFSAFSKGKNRNQDFKKHLKQKRCAIRRFNVYFFLKIKFWG